MAKLKGISENLNAFLDTLAYAEGTSTHPLTVNDGYDVIVTGVGGALEVFTDYSQHPFANGRKPKQINNSGLYSSASGRYQHMRIHWPHYKALLKLPDFSPESQDLWAIQLIRERKALALIEAGKFDEAIEAVASLWASLPGAGHKQPERSLKSLRNYFVSKGGKLWESNGSLPQSPVSLPQSSEHGLQQSESVNQNKKLNVQPTMLTGLWNLITKLLKRN